MIDLRQYRDRAIDQLGEGKNKYLSSNDVHIKKFGYSLFRQGLENLITYAKKETNVQVQKLTIDNIKIFLNDASNMDAYIKAQFHQIDMKQDNLISKQDKQKQEQEKLIKGVILDKPNISWDQVYGIDTAKKAIEEAIILPLKFPELFNGIRSPWKGILLYGPPGTGKTFIAKACSTLCNDLTFLCVSSSDLVSKFVGQSEKLMRNLFDLARTFPKAIIFIDEIDSILTTRQDGGEASNRLKTEFLVQMQGVSNNNKGILVIGATNLPWMLDPAVRRRFEKRIYIPLPNKEARLLMIKNGINNTSNSLNDHNFETLSALTEGFSGSDIQTYLREASFEPLRHCLRATHFKLSDNTSMPCSPSDPDAMAITLSQINPITLVLPPVDYVKYQIQILGFKDDFMSALVNCKPSVIKEDLDQYVKWTNEFGQ